MLFRSVDSFGQNYNPSVPANGGTNWMALQGNDYYSTSYVTTGGNYRYMSRFPHPKLQTAASVQNANWANIWLSYYDASPYAQSINYVSFAYQQTAAGGAAATGNITATTIGPSRNAFVLPVPGTQLGSSSPFFGMARVGNSGIAVAYYDAAAGTLKLATSAAAFNYLGTAGAAGTDNKTNMTANVRPVTTVTIANGTSANYDGKYFVINDMATPYAVYFDASAGQTGTLPAGAVSAGITNGIKVNITGLATAANIGNALNIALRASLAFRDTAINATATFGITAIDYAPATAPSVGTVGAGNITLTVATAGLTNWSTITIDSGTTVGSDVSLVSDGTNLYMAYKDLSNGQLKFARVPWAGTGAPSQGSVSVVVVDGQPSATTTVGAWTNISMMPMPTVTGASGSQPVIAYYADSFGGTKNSIRLAIPRFDATGVATLSAGVDGSDNYTGDWEVMTIQAVTNPIGGEEKFNKVQLGKYSSSTLPVVGWVGTKPEYAKLQPNN